LRSAALAKMGSSFSTRSIGQVGGRRVDESGWFLITRNADGLLDSCALLLQHLKALYRFAGSLGQEGPWVLQAVLGQEGP